MRRFMFRFAHVGKDFATVNDRFVLPGRTIHLVCGQLSIDYTNDATTDAEARAEAERYCEALRANGLSLFGMRADSEAGGRGWETVETITSASPQERAMISRALRRARQTLLEPPADEAQRQCYEYLQDAEEDAREAGVRGEEPPPSIFVALYKAIESIQHQFGGRDPAGKALGVGAELRDIGRICNEGQRDTRHAPRPGQPRTPVSLDEAWTAITKAKAVLQAYERYLGLPDPT